jgi:Skp family chaperone for outer membrane proteins
MGNTFYNWATILKHMRRHKFYSILICFLLSSGLNAQKNVRIGFLDLDRVLQANKDYASANQELEMKIGEWRAEIETRQQEIDKQKEALDLERPLLTEEVAEERAEDVAFEQEKLNQYIEKRFGTEGDWIKQKVLLSQPTQDAILTAIKEVAENRNLDYVFDSTADILVLHSEKKYDISDLVIRYIAFEEKKEALEFLAKSKKEERRQRSRPEANAKRKTLEERKAERERALKARNEKREQKKSSDNSGEASDETPELTAEEKRAKRKAELEEKKKARAEALEKRRKEQAEALEKRKKERLEELERRKKELEEQRKQTQQKK